MKDYYQILDLDRNSSQEELKKAYRQLVFQYHPDRNNGDKNLEDRFKEVNEAYTVLSDDAARREYDSGYGLNHFLVKMREAMNRRTIILLHRLNKKQLIENQKSLGVLSYLAAGLFAGDYFPISSMMENGLNLHDIVYFTASSLTGLFCLAGVKIFLNQRKKIRKDLSELEQMLNSPNT